MDTGGTLMKKIRMADTDRTKSHNGIFYIVISFALWMLVEYLTI